MDANLPRYDDSDSASEPPPAKRRRHSERGAVYEWTEKLACDHAGKYRDRKKSDLSPSKRRPHRTHGSIKCGCNAHIWIRKQLGSDQIDVEYHWQHNGHTPRSIKDMRESRMSERVKLWVDSRIAEGLDWRSIKDLIRIDDEILDKVHTYSIP